MNRSDLTKRILSNARLMKPVPTEVEALLFPLEGVKAVLFDIYGTLVTSASGDIDSDAHSDREGAFRNAFDALNLELKNSPANFSQRFNDEVLKAHARRRAEGVEYPEVEIREIWDQFLKDLQKDGILLAGNLDEAVREALAIEFECRANPVWPMPGMIDLLSALSRRGLRLGIVSNAQFYTSIMMEAFLGKPLEAVGFSPELCVYSYHEREGKPSVRLYQKLRKALAGQGIAATDCLYVGNDQRNDIWPAQEVGFRTALFAGDARSLRRREEDPRCAQVTPTVVLTALSQILEVAR